MLKENASLEEAQDFFKGDVFAYEATGCRLVEVSEGHAVSELVLDKTRHFNAMGGVMGGAIFTLADYALAAACNYNNKPTVSVSNTIEFISAAKGSKLIATCEADKSGRSLGFYTVEVADDTGRKVAKMTATCFR
ncbi:MAG: PaaI family thioesterase [Eggerthellaceae bacterium]|nr:PaaI family thioesterase [Eggerthellaceae bacterium]